MVLSAMVSAVSTASSKASSKMGGAVGGRASLPRLVPKTMAKFDETYSVGASVGRGAFAFVLQVTERKTKKEFVIKSIDVSVGYHSVPSWNDEEGLVVDETKMLAAIRECRIWNSLGRSPYVLKLIDVFVGKTVVNVVTEFCSSSFSRLMPEMQHWPEARIAQTFHQMLSGIAHVHDAGIVHRDIKPANFLLGFDRRAKLSDFGLARLVPRTSYLIFNLRGTAGTVGYMSPEMFSGHSYGVKTDVWSFGVTAYALTFAVLPFGAEAGTFAEAKQAVLHNEPSFTMPANRKVPAKLPDRIEFIKSMFQRNQHSRPCARQLLDHPFLSGARYQDHRIDTDEAAPRALTIDSTMISQEPDFIPLAKEVQEDSVTLSCSPTTLLLPKPESPQGPARSSTLWEEMQSVAEEVPNMPRSGRWRSHSDSIESASSQKALDHEESELDDADGISKISTICTMAPDSPRSPKHHGQPLETDLSVGAHECWVWI